MTITTECHERPPRLIIDGPTPDSPAGIVYRAAKMLEDRANVATAGPWAAEAHADHGCRVGTVDKRDWVAWTGYLDDEPVCRSDAEFIAALDPDVAKAIVASWEHLADDVNDHYGHFHATPTGWTVVDEYGNDRHDWAATVCAALKYLRETAPEVA